MIGSAGPRTSSSAAGRRAVGVDAVIARAGTAKMTLYRNFPSKDDLILDFLAPARAAVDPMAGGREPPPRRDSARRLLAIFDVFSDWFGQPDFEGCSFLTTMIEINDREHPVDQASGRAPGEYPRLSSSGLAAEAGVDDPDRFARKWHILMKGSIMAAHEGDAAAAAPGPGTRRAAARPARHRLPLTGRAAADLSPRPELLHLPASMHCRGNGACPVPAAVRSRSADARVSPRPAGYLRPGWLIFWKATSRAKSGEPWLGFSSMLNGEKPQSSVAASCSFGMKLAARTSASRTSSRALDPRVQRVDHPDVGHLRNALASSRQVAPR